MAPRVPTAPCRPASLSAQVLAWSALYALFNGLQAFWTNDTVYFFMDFTLAKMPAVCFGLTLLMSAVWAAACGLSRLKWRLLLGADSPHRCHIDRWRHIEPHTLHAALLDTKEISAGRATGGATDRAAHARSPGGSGRAAGSGGWDSGGGWKPCPARADGSGSTAAGRLQPDSAGRAEPGESTEYVRFGADEQRRARFPGEMPRFPGEMPGSVPSLVPGSVPGSMPAGAGAEAEADAHGPSSPVTREMWLQLS